MLQQFLKKKFNIEPTEVLTSPMTYNNYKISDLCETFKKRETENNIINNINMHNLKDPKIVLAYLTGIADRIFLENQPTK